MNPDKGAYGLIKNGAIAIDDGLIHWVGHPDDCPPQVESFQQISFGGRLVTPAMIDCHTHVVHGGNRAREFELRLNGASYEEVARAGGGIVSTVSATRVASETDLLTDALIRVDALIAEGVSTIEIKSGYGLDTDTELKMLRVAREIGRQRSVTVVTSYLGAHTIPADMDADDYIDGICIPTLEKAHALGLVDAVDGFCESIAFNPEQIERVFQKAQTLGLPVKLHAEQLNNLGGTALATRYCALSADHVEYATDDDARLMAASGTVAVLLPGAFYALRETQVPPVDAFRAHGVPMAVGTDWNPGTSPLGSLLLAMNMACTLFRLTPEEALAGTTHYAANALGLTDRGMIQPGLRADLAIWNVREPAELSYRIGVNPLHARMFGGRI
ncbi:MAG: imidazolonepropionase [Litoreibacter sp.]|nr:imidazolonepropionase [Litoreibacter sp.]